MKKYTVEELSNFPTLSKSQFNDLKVDNGEYRYWLTRMTREDGEIFPITIERMIRGNWVTVAQYGILP